MNGIYFNSEWGIIDTFILKFHGPLFILRIILVFFKEPF